MCDAFIRFLTYPAAWRNILFAQICFCALKHVGASSMHIAADAVISGKHWNCLRVFLLSFSSSAMSFFEHICTSSPYRYLGTTYVFHIFCNTIGNIPTLACSPEPNNA